MTHEQVMQVLTDPLAQELLQAPIPARLAYIGLDGSPRAIPVGFLWTGTAFVLGTATNSPKMAALRAHAQVALTIDTNDFPPHVLLVRGRAQVEIVDGVARPKWEGRMRNAERLLENRALGTPAVNPFRVPRSAFRARPAQEELARQAAGAP